MSSAKIGTAQMHETLKRKNPGKYRLPIESKIRTAISSLFTAQKKNGVDDEGGG